jgi:hypothetical protein
MWDIVSSLQYKEALRVWSWFISVHFPFYMICIIQLAYKPIHKNIYYNSTIYDGMTRNDFRKGSLIRFLGKIEVTEVPYNYDDDPNKAYWTDCINEDD